MRSIIRLCLVLSGCYASHTVQEPQINRDAAVVGDAGHCLIETPCWCHSNGDGTAVCYHSQEECGLPECRYGYGEGMAP